MVETSLRPAPTPLESNALRDFCHGLEPLRARLEAWMKQLCADGRLHQWVAQHGSPLNVLHTPPLQRNIRNLNRVAEEAGIDFRVFFARKANKTLGFVDASGQVDAGIDTASYRELRQVLDRGFDVDRVICTAAIKEVALLRACLAEGVTVAIDNSDEWLALQSLAVESDKPASVALRVSGFDYHGSKLDSRFGFDVADAVGFANLHLQPNGAGPLRLNGIHFHLDGYAAEHRIAAITQSLQLIDALRDGGHEIRFLDIGGGFPMSYLQSCEEWQRFWREHRAALQGRRDTLTYRNHGLGMVVADGNVHGKANCYPAFQTPVQADWLAGILRAPCLGTTVSQAIRERHLQLRCEPGRSLLDGCGITAARVEFCKRHPNGDALVGLSMNGTQCRTTSDDFLIDPLLLPRQVHSQPAETDERRALEGFLVGAYCTESEVLLKRKLRFPHGVSRGDLVVFPNTAGYLMHFLESRSHQFPLAKNVHLPEREDAGPELDDIDRH